MNDWLSRYPRELLALPLIAVLAVLMEVAWPGQSVATAPAGLLLLFVLPGYTVQAAAAPQACLGAAERALLTVGISMAVATISGLLLNLTPWGLRPQWWALFLGTVSVAAGVVALLRSEGGAPNQPPENKLISVSGTQAILLVVAAFVAASAFGLAHAAATSQPYQAFTQLSAVPGGTPGHPAVHLGITNGEGREFEYRLQISSAGQTIQEWPRVTVPPGQTWRLDFDLTADQTAGGIEARLYRSDAPTTVYRQVRLTAVVPPG